MGIIPHDFKEDSPRDLRSQDLPTELFKVMMNRGGKKFVYLTRCVQ